MYQSRQESFDWVDPAALVASTKAKRTGAFTDNMKLPVHRWFRYSAGFSAEWVEAMIGASDGILFDPFAGSGTSLLAAEACGLASAGAEAHPFVARIAKAKLGWHVDPTILLQRADTLLERAQSVADDHERPSGLLEKCFTDEALQRLNKLRVAYHGEPVGDSVSELLWLAITAILRECSGVGTAQWQYVLPNKSKAKVSEPFAAFRRRVRMFAEDIAIRAERIGSSVAHARLELADARALDRFDDLRGRVTHVVTSPPYPNNYDYADATRLEMTFWREIQGWSDLQQTVRKGLIRSCSQHSAAERLDLDKLLECEAVAPIRAELTETCRELAQVRETKGGRKTYHTMVAAYFSDLARVWQALRPLCADGAAICFVIGDSAPYGVHVPAERWLEKLALAAGFHEPRFDKVRDRNLKWKNRKHRVPLQEGNLWVRG